MVKWSARRLNVAGVKRAFSRIICSFKGRYMTLLIAECNEEKAAFIVSKKTAKRAVTRNRIKRRLRACYIELEEVPSQKALLFIGKIDALNAPYDELKKEMLSLLAKTEKEC